MKLTLGSIILGSGLPSSVELSDESGVIQTFTLEIPRVVVEDLLPYLQLVEEVVVGFVRQPDLDFLQHLPNVTRVWVLSPSVSNIDGLRHLSKIKSLAIDRPTCRMHVLGDLVSLEGVYLDDWRPGAQSVFQLTRLQRVGLQKYGFPDLQGMSDWENLQELWLNAGKLQTLSGVPPSLKSLRLTNQRKLDSLVDLSRCMHLESLIMQGCRRVETLAGIEQCTSLSLLSLARMGRIESLEPLRNLKNLEYVVLADGTDLRGASVEALYELPSLQRLIITKKSNLDASRLLEVSPNCEVTLAS